jgi:hypothetical protein
VNSSTLVRGEGNEWAALCDGLVIDLTSMNDVIVDSDVTPRMSRETPGDRRSARLKAVIVVRTAAAAASVTSSCTARTRSP